MDTHWPPEGAGALPQSRSWSEAAARRQPELRLRHVALGVLDGLRFVEHHGAPATHSDFAIAPIDDKNVAVFWADGDIKRIILQCAP